GEGQLAADAGALDAAEGEAGVALDDAVDGDVAGFDAGDVVVDAAAGGPEAGAEAERRGVGELDGVIGVVGAGDGGDGAEGFVAEGGDLRGAVGEEGGLVEGARALDALAAGDEAGALADGGVDLLLEVVEE